MTNNYNYESEKDMVEMVRFGNMTLFKYFMTIYNEQHNWQRIPPRIQMEMISIALQNVDMDMFEYLKGL